VLSVRYIEIGAPERLISVVVDRFSLRIHFRGCNGNLP